MYKPMRFFTIAGLVPFGAGFLLGIRFLVFMLMGDPNGHIQSLILASTLMMLGFMTFIVGYLADIVAANRKILEDVQYHVRKLDYDRMSKEENE